MNKIFSDTSWEDYQFWVENDRKILRKVNELLRDIERNGYSGLGKPEALKYDLEQLMTGTDKPLIVAEYYNYIVHMSENRIPPLSLLSSRELGSTFIYTNAYPTATRMEIQEARASP